MGSGPGGPGQSSHPSPGAVCDFRLSYGRVLSRSSQIIIVNRDRKDMMLNSDMFWKPQEAVQGASAPLSRPALSSRSSQMEALGAQVPLPCPTLPCPLSIVPLWLAQR